MICPTCEARMRATAATLQTSVWWCGNCGTIALVTSAGTLIHTPEAPGIAIQTNSHKLDGAVLDIEGERYVLRKEPA